MLPAIWFILSRQGCDQAALQAGISVSLTTPAEQDMIQAELRELRCVLCAPFFACAAAWFGRRCCCAACSRLLEA